MSSLSPRLSNGVQTLLLFSLLSLSLRSVSPITFRVHPVSLSPNIVCYFDLYEQNEPPYRPPHLYFICGPSAIISPVLEAGFSMRLIFISILPFFTHLHTFHSRLQFPQPVSPPSPLRRACNASHSRSSIDKALCTTHNDSHLWISPLPSGKAISMFLPALFTFGYHPLSRGTSSYPPGADMQGQAALRNDIAMLYTFIGILYSIS